VQEELCTEIDPCQIQDLMTTKLSISIHVSTLVLQQHGRSQLKIFTDGLISSNICNFVIDFFYYSRLACLDKGTGRTLSYISCLIFIMILILVKSIINEVSQSNNVVFYVGICTKESQWSLNTQSQFSHPP
jgi:hypothetical protein